MKRIGKHELIIEFFRASFFYWKLIQAIPDTFEQEKDMQSFIELHTEVEKLARKAEELLGQF